MKLTDAYYTTIIEFKRGKDFSVVVTYNRFNHTISFQEMSIPANTTKEIEEKFLEEAEKYLLKEVDDDSQFDAYGRWEG